MLVDNAYYSYGYDLFNGVPILPYYDDKQDSELRQLTDFLIDIKGVKDSKEAIRHFFMGDLYKRYANRPEILAQMMIKQRKKLSTQF